MMRSRYRPGFFASPRTQAERFGDIVDSKIVNDRESRRSRGFGFVTFRDEQSLRDDVEGMND
ncbi:hypothetical protein LguiA_017805 [Lonicera macranthoides]